MGCASSSSGGELHEKHQVSDAAASENRQTPNVRRHQHKQQQSHEQRARLERSNSLRGPNPFTAPPTYDVSADGQHDDTAFPTFQQIAEDGTRTETPLMHTAPTRNDAAHAEAGGYPRAPIANVSQSLAASPEAPEFLRFSLPEAAAGLLPTAPSLMADEGEAAMVAGIRSPQPSGETPSLAAPMTPSTRFITSQFSASGIVNNTPYSLNAQQNPQPQQQRSPFAKPMMHSSSSAVLFKQHTPTALTSQQQQSQYRSQPHLNNSSLLSSPGPAPGMKCPPSPLHFTNVFSPTTGAPASAQQTDKRRSSAPVSAAAGASALRHDSIVPLPPELLQRQQQHIANGAVVSPRHQPTAPTAQQAAHGGRPHPGGSGSNLPQPTHQQQQRPSSSSGGAVTQQASSSRLAQLRVRQMQLQSQLIERMQTSGDGASPGGNGGGVPSLTRSQILAGAVVATGAPLALCEPTVGLHPPGGPLNITAAGPSIDDSRRSRAGSSLNAVPTTMTVNNNSFNNPAAAASVLSVPQLGWSTVDDWVCEQVTGNTAPTEDPPFGLSSDSRFDDDEMGVRPESVAAAPATGPNPSTTGYAHVLSQALGRYDAPGDCAHRGAVHQQQQ